jgi:hypothetical protein
MSKVIYLAKWKYQNIRLRIANRYRLVRCRILWRFVHKKATYENTLSDCWAGKFVWRGMTVAYKDKSGNIFPYPPKK